MMLVMKGLPITRIHPKQEHVLAETMNCNTNQCTDDFHRNNFFCSLVSDESRISSDVIDLYLSPHFLNLSICSFS